jgi:hypothetical protein
LVGPRHSPAPAEWPHPVLAGLRPSSPAVAINPARLHRGLPRDLERVVSATNVGKLKLLSDYGEFRQVRE